VLAACIVAALGGAGLVLLLEGHHLGWLLLFIAAWMTVGLIYRLIGPAS
jgi:hypothetical protein